MWLRSIELLSHFPVVSIEGMPVPENGVGVPLVGLTVGEEVGIGVGPGMVEVHRA